MKIKAWAVLQTEDSLHRWLLNTAGGMPSLYPTRENARTAARYRRKQIINDLGYSLYESIRPVRITIIMEEK